MLLVCKSIWNVRPVSVSGWGSTLQCARIRTVFSSYMRVVRCLTAISSSWRAASAGMEKVYGKIEVIYRNTKDGAGVKQLVFN